VVSTRFVPLSCSSVSNNLGVKQLMGVVGWQVPALRFAGSRISRRTGGQSERLCIQPFPVGILAGRNGGLKGDLTSRGDVCGRQVLVVLNGLEGAAVDGLPAFGSAADFRDTV